jgi:pimeloyl-ACP methyl ester carboxylesterase
VSPGRPVVSAAPEGLTERTTGVVDVGEVRLAVAEAGRGGRPLLVVHGFTGLKEDFGDWIDPLADAGWWVVAPDLRGHGGSDHPDDEAAYSEARFADDLEGLVAHLGWEHFALLGHSMGGMIAQELVLRDPGRIEKLVLMDTHHGGVEGREESHVDLGMEILRTQGMEALQRIMADMGRSERSPAEERLRADRPGYAAWADTKVYRSSPAMFAAMAPALLRRPDRLPELAGLDRPTLVVVGAEDVDFLDAAARMGAAIPGAQLVVVPDAAHSPQLENPSVWWDAVAGFLGGA